MEGGRGRSQEGYQDLGHLLQGVDLMGGEPGEVFSRGMPWSVVFSRVCSGGPDGRRETREGKVRAVGVELGVEPGLGCQGQRGCLGPAKGLGRASPARPCL